MSRSSPEGSFASAHASMKSARVPARNSGPSAGFATAAAAPFAFATFQSCAATASSPASTRSRIAAANSAPTASGTADLERSSAARAAARTSVSPSAGAGAARRAGSSASVFGPGEVISGSPIVATRHACGRGSVGQCRPATRNGTSAVSRAANEAGGTNAVRKGSWTEPT